MGKGRYYVGHPEYQRLFREYLGYAPYPGTLNVKLEDRKIIEDMNRLRKMEGIKIGSFTMNGESFSALTCFDGALMGGEGHPAPHRCHILQRDRGRAHFPNLSPREARVKGRR